MASTPHMLTSSPQPPFLVWQLTEWHGMDQMALEWLQVWILVHKWNI